MSDKILNNDDNFKRVLASLNKNNPDLSLEDKAKLAMSICDDAPQKYIEAVGFGADIAFPTSSTKEFGETDSNVNPDAKTIEVEVVNDTAIAYPSEDGTMELFTFEKSTLERLGRKLEGIPVVIGKGHDADLPLAYFTDKYEVREVSDEHGRKRNALYAFAKVRSDEDAPVNAEQLFKDGKWAMNGGDAKLSGSLKFSSTDIPYFYEDGTKVNYMTHPAPRHYALLDSPYITDSGVTNKNFGKEVEEMAEEETKIEAVETTEAAAEETVEATEAPATEETPVEEAVEAPVEETVEEVVAEEATEEVIETAPEATVETVNKTDYDNVLARLEALEAELASARRDNLMEQIAVKKYGAEYSEEEKAELVDTVKAFGESELKGYLAGLTENVDVGVKSFGKGRVAEDNASTGVRLSIPYMNRRRK